MKIRFNNNIRNRLLKFLIYIANILDALFIIFLSTKAISYFILGLDAIGALFVCAGALWCISNKVWIINNRLDS